MVDSSYIRALDSVGVDDVALVGGKTVSLGELKRALAISVNPASLMTALRVVAGAELEAAAA